LIEGERIKAKGKRSFELAENKIGCHPELVSGTHRTG
jgi:hypothetical protein